MTSPKPQPSLAQELTETKEQLSQLLTSNNIAHPDDAADAILTKVLFCHLLSLTGWLTWQNSPNYLTALWAYHKANTPDLDLYQDRIAILLAAGSGTPRHLRPPQAQTNIGNVPNIDAKIDAWPDAAITPHIAEQLLGPRGILSRHNFTIAHNPDAGQVGPDILALFHQDDQPPIPTPINTLLAQQAMIHHLDRLHIPGLNPASVRALVNRRTNGTVPRPARLTAHHEIARFRCLDDHAGAGNTTIAYLKQIALTRHTLNPSATAGTAAFQNHAQIVRQALHQVQPHPLSANIIRMRIWLHLIATLPDNHPPQTLPQPNVYDETPEETFDHITADFRTGRHDLLQLLAILETDGTLIPITEASWATTERHSSFMYHVRRRTKVPLIIDPQPSIPNVLIPVLINHPPLQAPPTNFVDQVTTKIRYANPAAAIKPPRINTQRLLTRAYGSHIPRPALSRDPKVRLNHAVNSLMPKYPEVFELLSQHARPDYGFNTAPNSFFLVNQAEKEHFGIEDRFLVPIINSPSYLQPILANPSKDPRRLFMCSLPLHQLSGTGAHRYIRWAEHQAIDQDQANQHLDPWYGLPQPANASMGINRYIRSTARATFLEQPAPYSNNFITIEPTSNDAPDLLVKLCLSINSTIGQAYINAYGVNIPNQRILTINPEQIHHIPVIRPALIRATPELIQSTDWDINSITSPRSHLDQQIIEDAGIDPQDIDSLSTLLTLVVKRRTQA